MTVTRDVIFDLLPSYFAGEASDDTRHLVESFMASDPEFGKMARRFKSVYTQHPPLRDAGDDAERRTFERARSLVERRNEAFGGGIGFTLGAVFALIAAWFGGEKSIGGLVIAAAFGVVAAMSWVSWYLAGRQGRPSER